MKSDNQTSGGSEIETNEVRKADPNNTDINNTGNSYTEYSKSYPIIHSGTKEPKGTLANRKLRNKRIKTHKVFEKIWENNIMTKKEAYRWMTYMMGIPFDMGHIGKFSEYRCDELVKISEEILRKNNIKLYLRG